MDTLVGQSGNPGQGPHMILKLLLEDRIIREAKYETYPCLVAANCGQWICHAVEDKTIEEAKLITADDVRKGVGEIPLGRDHCPVLAADALRDALKELVTRASN